MTELAFQIIGDLLLDCSIENWGHRDCSVENWGKKKSGFLMDTIHKVNVHNFETC